MHYLYFVKDSTSHIKLFKSKKTLNAFVKKFKSDVERGDWLEFAFKSDSVVFYEQYDLDLERESK